tara:strand:- start:3204 stop:4262 length:1059 start_codon:yes stop_codon:yes gene_type:complete
MLKSKKRSHEGSNALANEMTTLRTKKMANLNKITWGQSNRMSQANEVQTPDCLNCDGHNYIKHSKNCPHSELSDQPNIFDKPTTEMKVDINNLTFNVMDEDLGYDPHDKRITAQLIDKTRTGEEVVGEWSILFFFKDAVSNQKCGRERRLPVNGHLGDHIFIEDEYTGLGLSRFLGKILANRIQAMINNKKLRDDDLLWIVADATGTYWSGALGMTTPTIRPPPHGHGWDVSDAEDDKWMTMREFINWANFSDNANMNSVKRLNRLLDTIEHKDCGKIINYQLIPKYVKKEGVLEYVELKSSSSSGGRKKITRKQRRSLFKKKRTKRTKRKKRKRRKRRKRRKSKRKKKARK